MDKYSIQNIIIESINNYLENNEENKSTEKISEKTILTGDNSIQLGSIGLIAIIVDIETRLNNEGIDISLISEESMAAKINPFSSVELFTNYIDGKINNGS